MKKYRKYNFGVFIKKQLLAIRFSNFILAYAIILLHLFCTPFLANAQERGLTLITIGNNTVPVSNNFRVNDTIQSLIIGISDYNEEVLRLKYAHKDAELFSDFLEKTDWTGNVKLLKNSEASATQIYKSIKDLINSANPEKPVFIYFAGHGDKVVESEFFSEAYLLAWDANSERSYDGTGGTIKFSELENFINILANKRKIKVFLILDACHSGFDSYKEGMLASYAEIQNNFVNATKLLSCSSDELSYEYSSLKQGVFTYFLVKGLSGHADVPADNNITLEKLEKYLQYNVKKETKEKQNPVIISNSSNNLVGVLTPDLKEILMKEKFEGLSGELYAQNRSTSQSSAEIPQLNPIILANIDSFNTAFANNNFYDSEKNCTYFIQKMAKEENTKEIANLMKDAVVNTLVTNSQLVINEILKGKIELPSASYFEKAKNDLDTALILLDKNDPVYKIASQNKEYLRAFIYWRKSDYQNYPTALQICDSLLQIEKNAAYIYQLKAEIHSYREEYDSVIYYADYASKLVPTWTYPYNSIGNAYSSRGNFNAALENFNTALKIDSNYLNAYTNIGNLYFNLKMYAKAEKYYLLALNERKDKSVTLSNLGVLYYSRGNFTKAYEYYLQSLENKNSYLGYLKLGNLYSDNNSGYTNSDKAESFYKKALELEPYNSECYISLADFHRINSKNEADWQIADTLYDYAIKLNPHNTWAYFGKIYLHIFQFKNKDIVNNLLEKCELYNGTKSYFKRNLARYYNNIGEQDSALELYKKSISEDPYYANFYTDLYNLLIRKKEKDSALLILNNGVRMLPDNPGWYSLLGDYYYSNGQYEKAIDWYSKCLEIDPQFAIAYASIGICYLELFNAVNAVSFIKLSIDANPEKNKASTFINYAIVLAEKIIDKENKFHFLNYLLIHLENTNENLLETTLQQAYLCNIYDENLMKKSYSFVIENPEKLSINSKLTYLLSLIAIELRDYKKLEDYYQKYLETTRSPDPFLEVIAFRLLPQNDIYYDPFVKKQDFKSSSYGKEFNKLVKTLIFNE